MDRTVTNFNTRLRTITIRRLAAWILIAMVITVALAAIFPEFFGDEDICLLTFLLLMILFFANAVRGTTGLRANFDSLFVRKTRNEILYVFIINLAFAFIFTFVIAVLDMLVGMADPTWVSVIDIDSVDMAPGAFLFSLMTSIIIAPLIEELIFRGVLFNRLKIRTGMLPAMLISSFLFAIGHDFGGITSAFLFGMCMCILYLKTDNILVPMAVHFINNLTAFFIEISSIEYFFSQFPQVFLLGLIVAVSTLLLIKYIVENVDELKKVY